jgi:hypothetical protein
MFVVLSSAFPPQELSKSASIMLEVKDESGAIVQNAQVQILPLPNTIGKSPTTDSGGKLYLNVPPGTYDLSVNVPGFALSTKRIEVKPDTSSKVDIVLKVQGCPPGSCVEVSSGGVISQPVPFPAQSLAISPDGHHIVVNVDSDEDPHHTVFLEDWFLKTRRKLFNYERHVALLWNSDSQLLAVTDYIGSDTSRCSIISVDDKVPPMQALDLLFRQLGEDAKKTLQSQLSNHHAYVEATGWDGPTSVVLKVSGYGERNPAGFAEFYDLHLPIGKP